MWSSFLVSSALSVFLNRGSCELDVTVNEESKGRQSASDCDQAHDDLCDVSLTSRLDLSSANVTPVAVIDMSVLAARSSICSSRQPSSGHSLQLALASRLTEVDHDRGAVDSVRDGLSLLHRAAGASFVRHVLSKGNSVDVWQGFLSFIGKCGGSPPNPPRPHSHSRRAIRPHRFSATARARRRRCRI